MIKNDIIAKLLEQKAYEFPAMLCVVISHEY